MDPDEDPKQISLLTKASCTATTGPNHVFCLLELILKQHAGFSAKLGSAALAVSWTEPLAHEMFETWATNKLDCKPILET